MLWHRFGVSLGKWRVSDREKRTHGLMRKGRIEPALFRMQNEACQIVRPRSFKCCGLSRTIPFGATGVSALVVKVEFQEYAGETEARPNPIAVSSPGRYTSHTSYSPSLVTRARMGV